MIDRLIISADSTGNYEKLLLDRQVSIEEKNRERYLQQKKYKWIDNLTVKTF